jgi:putative DNA primase/helicase
MKGAAMGNVTAAWAELWTEAKHVDLVELAQRLGARLKRSGPHWTGPCPRGCAHKDGFIVTPSKRLFFCRPSGATGDAVDMVEHALGVSRKEALAYVLGNTDLQPPAPSQRPAREEARQGGLTTTRDALELCRGSVDPCETLVERYLNARKLNLEPGLISVLRWHPGLGAMLALYRNILSGEPQAVSRTFLNTDGKKTGRKFTGPVGGAAIMLDPFENVLEGLHIGEGVETCMAARQLGLRPTWALGSTTGIANFPVLSGVEAITLIRENDTNGASQRACEACAARWHAAGREVRIDDPDPEFNDLNDILTSGTVG